MTIIKKKGTRKPKTVTKTDQYVKLLTKVHEQVQVMIENSVPANGQVRVNGGLLQLIQVEISIAGRIRELS